MNKPASKCPESTQRAFEAAGDAVPWLRDADLMGELVRDAMHYWETSHDPVVGMYSMELGFRVVHRLEGPTFFNSDRKYAGPSGDGKHPGDVVSLGKTLNMKDGQKGELLARVLGPEVATPPEYRHYLVYAHTYLVLVD